MKKVTDIFRGLLSGLTEKMLFFSSLWWWFREGKNYPVLHKIDERLLRNYFQLFDNALCSLCKTLPINLRSFSIKLGLELECYRDRVSLRIITLREKSPNTERILVRIQENTGKKVLHIWTLFTQCKFHWPEQGLNCESLTCNSVQKLLLTLKFVFR